MHRALEYNVLDTPLLLARRGIKREAYTGCIPFSAGFVWLDACANICSPCSIRGSHYKDWLFTRLSPSTVSLANMKSNGIFFFERGVSKGGSVFMHRTSNSVSEGSKNSSLIVHKQPRARQVKNNLKLLLQLKQWRVSPSCCSRVN